VRLLREPVRILRRPTHVGIMVLRKRDWEKAVTGYLFTVASLGGRGRGRCVFEVTRILARVFVCWRKGIDIVGDGLMQKGMDASRRP
jgi:hypothetical protein